MTKIPTEYKVLAINTDGDAEDSDFFQTRTEAELVARNMAKDGRAVATVVEKIVDGDQTAGETLAFFGDYAALRRGGWIRFANQAAA